MNDPNRGLITAAARLLKPILGDLLFVGGCATGLLITDRAAPQPRSTTDVDVIVNVTSRLQFRELEGRIMALGFIPDQSEDAPLCRFLSTDRLITLDVMPTDEAILGFGNPWYAPAMRHALTYELTPNLSIQLISAPFFAATKLDAFRGRGDYLASRDLEDFVTLVDGRPELAGELSAAPANLKAHVAREVCSLLSNPDFEDALPGYLPPDTAGQGRLPTCLARLRALAARP